MSSPEVRNKLYALVMFGVVSVLAGLLVAGFVVPFAAIAGSTGRLAADSLENLPAELEVPPASMRSTVYLADGSVLANFYDENRIVVGLDQIAPIMRTAQLAIEDHRFYEHGAIDLRGTLRALITNTTGSAVQGGSTLTQQYVKQVQIEAAQARGDKAGVLKAQEQTVERKILEMRYAIALETKLSKDAILERYLNIAYYGDGAYGVEAAARHYFSVIAKDLTLGQAAMLAGLVQNPVATDPVRNPDAAIERRNIVLNRMASDELQLITKAQAEEAKKEVFDRTKVSPARNGCVGTRYPFVCDYVYRTLKNNPGLGATSDDRENTIKRGGIVVHTLIDPATQDTAQEQVSRMIAPTDPVISTMVTIQPGTGLILSMAQNRPVMGTNAATGETFYNYAVEAKLGGAEGYQAGSTFKAFTVAAALAKGIPPSRTYDAKSPMEFKGQIFESCDGKFKFNQDYKVSNSTTSGTMDMMKGTASSVNTYFIQLEQAAGICQAAQMADVTGAKLSNGKLMADEYDYAPSFTLGVAEVTPISMATAYATFAARGVRCDPIIVKEITSREGKPISTQSANCKQVIPAEIADGVNYVLQGVMKPGGTGNRVAIRDGRPQAGKTGTIDSNRAVWFVGYTPQVAGAAMIAIDNSPQYKPYWGDSGSLKNKKLPVSGTFLEGSGSGDAGDIWTPTMTAYLRGADKTPFVAPPDEILKGKRLEAPNLRGKSASEIQSILEGMGFTVSKRNTYDNARAGAFIGVQCSWQVGDTCYLLYSSGPRPAADPTAPPAAPAPNAPR